MEDKRKKGNGLIIAVIVLLAILIGLVGFYIYNDMNNKDKTDSNNNGSEVNNTGVTKLTKDSQIVQYLNNVFFDDGGAVLADTNYGIYRLLYGTEKEKLYEKLRIAFKTAVDEESGTVSCSKLENYKLTNIKEAYDGIVMCGREYLLDEYGNDYDKMSEMYKSSEFNDRVKNSATILVKKEKFDSIMKRLFGDDIKYTYEDLDFGFVFTNYTYVRFDKKVNGYVMYSGYWGSGDTAGPVTLNSIKQNGDKLSLIYKDFLIEQTVSHDSRIITLVLNFELDKNGNYIFVDAVEEK